MPHTKTYDVVRVENRSGGHREHLGTVEAMSKELAEERAAAFYECPPQCSLVVSGSEPEEQPESTHTPGPWIVKDDDPHDHVFTAKKPHRRICGVYGGITGSNDADQEGLANARLIASAPMLLEALENLHVLTRTMTYPRHGAVDRAQLQALAAIAAARGN